MRNAQNTKYCSPTVIKSAVNTMSRKRLMNELLMRKDFGSVDEIKDAKTFPMKGLRTILLAHATPDKKRSSIEVHFSLCVDL